MVKYFMLKNVLGDKRVVLFAAAMVMLALVILVGALNNISFRPAQALIRNTADAPAAEISMGKIADAFLEIPLWKQISFFVAMGLLILLVISILSPEARKRLLAILLRVALSALAIYYLLKANPDLFKGLFPQFDNNNAAAATNVENAAPTFETPQVSGVFSFFVTVIILALLTFLLWKIYQWQLRFTELKSTERPLDEIAKVARASLREISTTPADSHNAIIQCYADMSKALNQKRGLQRNYAMTAAEFAQKLEHAGLPREPVARLTHLFEAARYGAKKSTQGEVDEAIACLTAILKHCGATV